MAPASKKRKLGNGVVAAVEEPAQTAPPQQETEQAVGEKPAEKPEQQRRSLFVRALPPSATSDSLTALFSESYPIKHATAVIDASTKQCRGYGFVTFADAEDAQRAKAEFHGHMLEGRKLRIEVAEPRQRDGEGSGAADKAEHIKAQREVQQQPTKLIVRNLPWSIKGSNQLEKLFQSYGKIKQAYVPKKAPGLMAGFGFVVMRGHKNAEKAIEGVNGKEIDGRTLAVDWAVEKTLYAGAGQETQGVHAAEKQPGDAFDMVDDDLDADLQEDVDEEGESAGEDLSNGELDSEDNDEIDEDVSKGVGVDDEDIERPTDRPDERSTTIFVRNLPFTCTDEDLEDHFSRFGTTRYARIVVDAMTERSKGTGFVCFYNTEDADACLRGAPKRTAVSAPEKATDGKPTQPGPSILQNEDADASGQYTLDGRVLQVSCAVQKNEATRLTEEGAAHRNKQKEDRRRLYLLSEGTIPSKSKLYEKLSPSEKTMREASARQRKALIESNPSLSLSLTRLSVRNVPRTIGSKELKALAREAVVGFATDVKAGTRQPISKEELARGGEEMLAAEQARKKAGKGLVRQAKVVFEASGGSKVSEDTGAGRSRGYGFIEYYTHRSALMGLRWLNGQTIGYQVKDNSKNAASREEVQDRKKRLIVEFAIENAQVVMRRKERELKARERSLAVSSGKPTEGSAKGGLGVKRGGRAERAGPRKRKRDSDSGSTHQPGSGDATRAKNPVNEKLARRNQIIGRKRAMRKSRKGGGS